jgi:hypothetical protein
MLAVEGKAMADPPLTRPPKAIYDNNVQIYRATELLIQTGTGVPFPDEIELPLI